MIEISEYYTTNRGLLNFEYDKIEVNSRPAWIKILDKKEKIKFLKVNTTSGRFFYTSFIDNYYLVEDASNEEVSIFYNEICEIYNKKMQSHKIIGDFIVNNLNKNNLPKQIPILSICSGSGIEMKKVIDGGYQNITLLDVSKNMLNIAKKDSRFKDCKFIISDFLQANFKKMKYDILICSMGIHYFNGDSLNKFLIKCKHILSKTGEFHIININIPLIELERYFRTEKIKNYEIEDENGKKTKVLYYIGKIKVSD